MKDNRLIALAVLALAAVWPAAAAPRLKYVVIVTRHGVRAPTWDADRLKQYSAEPWPDWGVAPAELTPHGRTLIQLMGAYYRQWLAGEQLLSAKGCADASRIHIVADTSQRTLETGRALSESLMPVCAVPVHSEPQDGKDPLFSGSGAADPERSLQAVRARLGAEPQKLLTAHRAALDALQFILTGGRPVPQQLFTPPGEIGVSFSAKAIELTGPFAVGSTMSENLLLEYTNGFQGAALGWGRLTRENLFQVLEIHALYADLMRRTPYLARARGSNLLQHVLLSLEQAASGVPVAGALGRPGDAALILAGHDTNLSNLSGMLDLSWRLAGYQPDDTPPGGALIFELWRDAGRDSVTVRYTAQSVDQMRNAVALTKAAPPESQTVSVPGCPAAAAPGCSWPDFKAVLQKAIDPAFVAAPKRPAPARLP